MILSLYADQHVRSEITEGLRRRGVEVLTAYIDGRAKADDSLILDRATELGRILFTQDDDFLAIAAERQRRGIRFTGIVYGHQLAVTIGQCIDDLELICRACGAEELENRVLYLPL